MNHPVLIGVAMVALSVVSYWGLMKLEVIKPKKKSKRRRAKRMKGWSKIWVFFKRLFFFTKKELLIGIALVSLFSLIFAVIIEDLLLAVITTAILVILHFKLHTLRS